MTILPIGSPGPKSEMASATGLNCQRVHPEKALPWVSWRREWDSNPRYGFPHTRFPSVRLKPLGHLSGWPVLKGREDFCKGARPSPPKFPQCLGITSENRDLTSGAELPAHSNGTACAVGLPGK